MGEPILRAESMLRWIPGLRWLGNTTSGPSSPSRRCFRQRSRQCAWSAVRRSTAEDSAWHRADGEGKGTAVDVTFLPTWKVSASTSSRSRRSPPWQSSRICVMRSSATATVALHLGAARKGYSTSSTIVTGPSFTSATSMRAPNTPI